MYLWFARKGVKQIQGNGYKIFTNNSRGTGMNKVKSDEVMHRNCVGENNDDDLEQNILKLFKVCVSNKVLIAEAYM